MKSPWLPANITVLRLLITNASFAVRMCGQTLGLQANRPYKRFPVPDPTGPLALVLDVKDV